MFPYVYKLNKLQETSMSTLQVYCLKPEPQCICSALTIPSSFWKRAKGLLGKSSMTNEEGVLFYHCSSIHMIGMKFPIDVVYLNNSLEIVKLVESIKPWQVSFCHSAVHTLELASGSISKSKLKLGEKLQIRGIE